MTWQIKPDDMDRIEETYAAQVRPTALGAELFLWGHGFQQIDARLLFDREASFDFLTDVPETPGVTLLQPPAGDIAAL